jgi:hypothetical protein
MCRASLTAKAHSHTCSTPPLARGGIQETIAENHKKCTHHPRVHSFSFDHFPAFSRIFFFSSIQKIRADEAEAERQCAEVAFRFASI